MNESTATCRARIVIAPENRRTSGRVAAPRAQARSRVHGRDTGLVSARSCIPDRLAAIEADGLPQWNPHDEQSEEGRAAKWDELSSVPQFVCGHAGNPPLPLTTSYLNSGSPARCPPMGRKVDLLDRQAGARDQPGDDRVRVPHVARLELVSPPHGRRHGGNELEHAMRRLWIISHAHGAGDRFVDVWDRSARPAADLVAEESQAPAKRLPTGPSATTPRRARHASGDGATSMTKKPSPRRTWRPAW